MLMNCSAVTLHKDVVCVHACSHVHVVHTRATAVIIEKLHEIFKIINQRVWGHWIAMHVFVI